MITSKENLPPPYSMPGADSDPGVGGSGVDGPAPQTWLSVLEDYRQIADMIIPPVEDETMLTEHCHHLDVRAWDELDRKVIGPQFEAGGFKWNLMLFPRGNMNPDYVAVYLQLASAKSDPNAYACAQFAVCVSTPSVPTHYVSHTASHRFDANEPDWGFLKMVSIDMLRNGNPAKGQIPLLEDNCTRITVILRIYEDPVGTLWRNLKDYDCKKETGAVGLKNAGSTDYMSSLLPAWQPLFDKLLYKVDTWNQMPTKNVIFALQRVFFNLVYSEKPVPVDELCASFGWDELSKHTSQDVYEFLVVLLERLDVHLQDTELAAEWEKLLQGEAKTYYQCRSVSFQTVETKPFRTLELRVKNFKDLHDSLDNYTRPRLVNERVVNGTLKGKKVGTGNYTLADVRETIRFQSLPPILHIKLDRIEIDKKTGAMHKVPSRYIYESEIDLEPYLDFTADISESHVYTLFSVIVHDGTPNVGRYFAYTRSPSTGYWLKYDPQKDMVIRATQKQVFANNFGDETLELDGSCTAYVLIYIRKSMYDSITYETLKASIPTHIQKSLDALESEKEARRILSEKIHIRVYTDEAFRANTGAGFFQNNPGESKSVGVHSFDVLKSTTLIDFDKQLGDALGIEGFRLWLMVRRQNQTIRPYEPLVGDDLSQTIRQLYTQHAYKDDMLRLYVETPPMLTSGNVPVPLPPAPPGTPRTPIMLFIKLFDPFSESLRGVGNIYVMPKSTVASITEDVNDMLGYNPFSVLEFYEEIKPGMVDKINALGTFEAAELINGDIVCVQLQLTEIEARKLAAEGKSPTVPMFYIDQDF